MKLAKSLRSAYQGLASWDEGNKIEPLPASRRRKEQDSLVDQYVAKLQQVYQAPSPQWEPLPRCKHIKLAMIKEKGER